MKKRYTEEQIVKILKEVEAIGKPAEPCRKYGVSDATIYNWRRRYGGLELSDLRKLKTLEEENRRLKKIVADKELDLDALKALLEKYDGAR
jgi:putative transposase